MASLLIRILLTISLLISIGFLYQMSFIRNIATLISLLLLNLFISWKLSNKISSKFINSNVNPAGKICLITGCDTGFGKEVAIELVRKGFTVFAGCLNPTVLRGINVNLHPVKLDVTIDEDIIDVHSVITNYLIENPKKKFWALINNAGISNFSAIEWGSSTDEMFTKLFNVNVIGSVKVSRVFIPLLKLSRKSRIIFMSSYSSRVSFPAMVPYSMTKAAIKSFADGLRRELSPTTIKTVTIEPSMYRTPLTTEEVCRSNLESNWTKTPKEIKSSISIHEKEFIESKVDQYLKSVCEESSQVVQSVVNSVVTINPNEYYFIYGNNLFLHVFLSIINYLPEEIIDIILTFDLKLKLFNDLIAAKRLKQEPN